MKSAKEVFCDNQWKIGSSVLIIVGLGLFVWAFQLYRTNGLIYGPQVAQPEAMNAIQQTAGQVSGSAPVNISSNLGQKNRPPVMSSKMTDSLVKITISDGQKGRFTAGSGVVVSDYGHIVTALHLITDVKTIQVNIKNRSYDAQLIKKVPESNLAILKIISNDVFSYTALAPISVKQGQHVYAVGVDNEIIVRPGSVVKTNTRLVINNQSYRNLIETNAIDSWILNGGPLLNYNGHLAGINLAIQDAGMNITGYAIPSQVIFNNFQDIVDFNTLANLKGVAKELNLGVQNASRKIVDSVQAEKYLYNLWQQSKETSEKIFYMIEDGKWLEQNYFESIYSSAVGLSSVVANQLFHAYQVQGFQLAIDTINDPQITFMGYSINSILALSLLGFISGISAGMVTMGGGIIKISGLMLFFGYGLAVIRPVAYITNIFVYGAASLRYRKKNLISWENVTPMIPFAIFGFVFGYLIGNELDNTTIRFLLGGFALCIFVKTLMEIIKGDKENKEENVESNEEVEVKKKSHSWLGLPMGVISGILGISGGVIETPLQRYFLKLPLKEAIANSAVLVFCTSSLGAVVAMVHGAGIGAFDIKTPIVLAAIVIPGSFLGGLVGAWLTERISINLLKAIYAAIMLLIAIRMLFYFV